MNDIDYYEAIDLAKVLVGKDVDDDVDDVELEHDLVEKFNIDIESLASLAGALLPLCNVHKSGLTNKKYRGFATDDCWVIKREVEDE